MKRILNFVIALFICGNLFSQTPLTYRFRKPTVVNATTWKFASVSPGINAIVTLTGSKNATLDRIDDSSVYAFAWQPFVKITNKMTKASDSSYLEFNIAFQKSSNNAADTQNVLAMTVIDCDGSGSSSFRELIKVSLPATATTISGSNLVEWNSTALLNIVSGTGTYANIDTSIYAAMTQINFKNIASYTMRIGVVGAVAAATIRQTSFYFKPFSAFSQPLPVSLVHFDATLNNVNTNLTWSTSSEENLSAFEVCRSTDGHNFLPIGRINANMNSNDLVNYNFTDYEVKNINSAVVYYNLKMISNEGSVKWSDVAQIRITDDNIRKEMVTVWPNPTSDILNVTLKSLPESEINIEIMDVNGKVIQNFYNPEISNNNTMSFDIKNFDNGLYVINVLNSDGCRTSGKFIKR